MIVNTKHGKVEVDIYRDKEGISENIRFFRIIATDGQTEVGHLNFKTNENGHVWIYHIETNQFFQHKGVAQAMLDVFEVFCVKEENSHHVEGRYFPENEFAKPFYEKNDFDIFEDCYDYFILKNFDKTKILTQTAKNIEGEMKVLDYTTFKQQKQKQEEAKGIVKHFKNKKPFSQNFEQDNFQF